MKVSLFITAAVAALASTTAMAQATPAANATFVNGANPGNVGTAAASETADFTITGTVSQACVLGAGGDLNDVNFGTIGIYADATSTVENVFTSVGPANGHTRTNLAGCNTSNTMTIRKTNGVDGLRNTANVGGYDSNVFQANIPYSIAAQYTAGAVGTLVPQASISQFSVSTTEDQDSKSNAAWKSGAAFRIDISDPTKALIAGTYSDTVTVELAAL
ncbi:MULTISPECIES: hypothetical protein [unclassified Sphingopyxis]|uniref:hypothetical protein n=1 Tax=unclassified Sphingopyxis TaxID=2614943 RepID=UPI00285AEF59|nr:MULTISPECIES: hypothetical protein [unclassified Sphingopyxis]MDR6834395.1 hypothetical protein [Sphingopyxis sp. BE122]MDR7226664.1 hypothetical protein [Sphingopyxis sp. BE259]